MTASTHIELEPEHLSVIQALADETRRPLDDVNRIYAETFERLNSDARIKDYLVLLTAKSVRDALRHSETEAGPAMRRGPGQVPRQAPDERRGTDSAGGEPVGPSAKPADSLEKR